MYWFEDPGTEVFRGLSLLALRVDQAYLNITTSYPVHLYSLSEECERCPYLHVAEINSTRILTVDTKRNVIWRLYNRSDELVDISDNRLLVCEIVPENLGEFGVYDLIQKSGNCKFVTAKEPVNIYLPLAFIVACLLLLLLVYGGVNFVWSKYFKTTKSGDNEGDGAQVTKRPRIRALDTFRGICLVFMVFVNDGAGHYWFLEHATWDGLLFSDWLFPWFMWIMGVCIPISVKSQFKKGFSRISMLLQVIRRSFVLFLLGMMLNTVVTGPKLHTIRVFGVLQRFGVAYFIVSALVILLSSRNSPRSQNKLVVNFKDVISLIPQWFLALGLVALHCYIVFYVQAPGCPVGYMGPGGIQDGGIYRNCSGGITKYVDVLLLGSNHMFQRPTVAAVYKTSAFDPEGIFGCILSSVQVFLGVQAGATLISFIECKARVKRWLFWGVVCTAVGLTLSIGGWIPINKNLWSLSFVMITSGMAFLLLTICYLLVDHYNYWSGFPFIYPGMNSLLVFVGHTMCYHTFPFHWALNRMNTHFILTLEAVYTTALWVLVSAWLYSQRFFLTV